MYLKIYVLCCAVLKLLNKQKALRFAAGRKSFKRLRKTKCTGPQTISMLRNTVLNVVIVVIFLGFMRRSHLLPR